MDSLHNVAFVEIKDDSGKTIRYRIDARWRIKVISTDGEKEIKHDIQQIVRHALEYIRENAENLWDA